MYFAVFQCTVLPLHAHCSPVCAQVSHKSNLLCSVSVIQYFSISVFQYFCISTSGPSQPSLCTRVSFTSQIYFAVFQYFSISVIQYFCASTSGPSQPSLCTLVSFTSQIYFAVFQYFSVLVFQYFALTAVKLHNNLH